MSKWYLVRHGENEFDCGQSIHTAELTVKGVNQAYNASLFFDYLPGKETFQGRTSGPIDCLQTALSIMDRTGIKFKVTSLLGNAPTGKPYSVFLNKYFSPNFEWENGVGSTFCYNETQEAYQKRLDVFIEQEKDKNLIIVSHTQTIQDLIRKLTGEKPTIPNGGIFLIQDGKLTDS